MIDIGVSADTLLQLRTTERLSMSILDSAIFYTTDGKRPSASAGWWHVVIVTRHHFALYFYIGVLHIQCNRNGSDNFYVQLSCHSHAIIADAIGPMLVLAYDWGIAAVKGPRAIAVQKGHRYVSFLLLVLH